MYPDAYINYLILFHSYRDFFECHEVLEEQWKMDPKGERKKYWKGFIQFAVTLYHYRRGNIIGAKKMIKKAINNFELSKNDVKQLGVNYDKLMATLLYTQDRIQTGKDYIDVNIPLTDQSLEKQCKRKSLELGLQWCAYSNMNDYYLINKHKLRRHNE